MQQNGIEQPGKITWCHGKIMESRKKSLLLNGRHYGLMLSSNWKRNLVLLFVSGPIRDVARVYTEEIRQFRDITDI